MPLPDLEVHPLTELKPPTDFSPDALRLWISEACDFLKITPTELARAANVSPSTINKFLLGAGSDKSLTGRTVDKVLKAAFQIQIGRIGQRQVEALAAPRPDGFALDIVRVAASIKKDSYKESHRWASEELFFVTIPLPTALRGKGLLGFLMEDTSDNHPGMELPFGTILVGSKFDPENDKLEPGNWFVVTKDDGTGKTELSVRQLAVSPKGDMWLIAETVGPDAYLGKTRPDGTVALSKDTSQYVIEYKVIVAIRPMTRDFEGVNFRI
ncbi:helix-turn-helix domain-containing protein [Bradyrhizobium sp. WU425]|uniref:helix-turn-helix domain-containing protein n=1 Tax=Bradyrhizobium sp. WU425 TaxID=187029 RepID=UPI001E31DE52|nr:helix-turn-helix transcriptional regulator [Bradyrhizobium canariense]UFW75485.1 helix-turn-helix transcriptional regulator [Bradyrhizobium canariense]